MNIAHFEAFLDSTTIPAMKQRPKTFLGIAKQPHYENVLSNIYAFYFDPYEEHEFKDLFVSSLIELHSQKRIGLNHENPFSFTSDFSVYTEYSTIKKGRIDLLLLSSDEALIIENKVYHFLNNGLDDYWDSIKDIAEKNKAGIVLSLVPVVNINHKGFINITHLELMNHIFSRIGDYILGCNEKYLTFLKDLYQNIQNITNPMDKESMKFFFNHKQEIVNLVSISDSIRKYIKEEVEQSRLLLNYKTESYSSRGVQENRLRYFLSPKNRSLYFTILFEHMFLADKPNEILIIVEMEQILLSNIERFKQIEFSEPEKHIISPGFYKRENKYYAHFACEPLKVDENIINNLQNQIANQINNGPLLSIFRKLDEFLTNEKLK